MRRWGDLMDWWRYDCDKMGPLPLLSRVIPPLNWGYNPQLPCITSRGPSWRCFFWGLGGISGSVFVWIGFNFARWSRYFSGGVCCPWVFIWDILLTNLAEGFCRIGWLLFLVFQKVNVGNPGSLFPKSSPIYNPYITHIFSRYMVVQIWGTSQGHPHVPFDF